MGKKKAEKIKKDIILSIKKELFNSEPDENEGIRREKLLCSLSKKDNFELEKHSIAFAILLDEDFKTLDKKNLEIVSAMLFEDKTTLKKIEDDVKLVTNYIYGTNLKGYLETASKLTGSIPKLPIKGLVKASLHASKSAIAAAATTTVGAGLGYTYHKQKSHVKDLKVLSLSDFSNKLIFNALSLLYARRLLDNEIEFRIYFKSILDFINVERVQIMKEFAMQYEFDANKLKIRLLQRFDDYVIEHVLKPSKKEK